MMPLNFYTPHEILLQIALRAKEKRLFLNLSQKSLSDRSGVSFGVIKKFERTGKISLESLLKLAFVLDALNEFAGLFSPKSLESYSSINQLLAQKPRRRGRK
jgi:transcriptional regulator with XRE-family HTH domain